MSLTGNLEDLPLLDILQIVSFSKKTGYLSIRTGAGEGAIVFCDGFVTSSFTWDTAPLDPRAKTLPPDQRSRMLRHRIEVALQQLIRLREGQFNFSLSDEAPTRVGARDILEETLPDGINPQELLLGLARGMDEDRRDSTAALEASFTEPEDDTAPVPVVSPLPSSAALEPSPAPEPSTAPPVRAPRPPPVAAAPPKPAPAPARPAPSAPSARPSSASSAASAERVILLVDDEEEVRRILADHFTAGGYQVVEAEDPEAAVKKAGRLGKAGIPFLLVSDLGMPTSGGSSFQGGFEVVKRLGKMNLHPPVLMMTESFGSALQSRAKQMGIARIVFKPGLSKLDPGQFEADLRAFAHKLIADVIPRLAPAAEVAPAAPRSTPRKSPSAPSARPPAPSSAVSAESPLPSAEELSREFAILQKRLEELRRPNDASQIAMLVMKMAREFFERGVLFLVKNGEARGLGGFGPAPREESLHLLARDVLIPLSEPSVFLDVVVSHKSLVGPLPEGRWSQYLMGKIGRFRSATVALLPLLTHRETIALLFGDNPETGRPFGRLEALEMFIDQAGIALENAFLQRKVHTLQGRE